jgi:hypothetical protein
LFNIYNCALGGATNHRSLLTSSVVVVILVRQALNVCPGKVHVHPFKKKASGELSKKKASGTRYSIWRHGSLKVATARCHRSICTIGRQQQWENRECTECRTEQLPTCIRSGRASGRGISISCRLLASNSIRLGRCWTPLLEGPSGRKHQSSTCHVVLTGKLTPDCCVVCMVELNVRVRALARPPRSAMAGSKRKLRLAAMAEQANARGSSQTLTPWPGTRGRARCACV